MFRALAAIPTMRSDHSPLHFHLALAHASSAKERYGAAVEVLEDNADVVQRKSSMTAT